MLSSFRCRYCSSRIVDGWARWRAIDAAVPLDRIAVLLDRTALDGLLAVISASHKGELGWPPLALFRALLLACGMTLSDVRLAESLDDRASFRRFCGFAAHEPTPERTAFVRFRRVIDTRTLFDVRRSTLLALQSGHPSPATRKMKRQWPSLKQNRLLAHRSPHTNGSGFLLSVPYRRRV